MSDTDRPVGIGTLLKEGNTLIRQAYDAGFAAGEEKERARLISLIQESMAATTETSRPRQLFIKTTPPPSEYGAISNPVRGALWRFKTRPEGVTALEITNYCRRTGSNVSAAQVRTALKVLAKRSEATRLERGKYTVGPELRQPDADEAAMEQETPSDGADGVSE